jgi:hypothetical protein
VNEAAKNNSEPPTLLDFGCGLGRNSSTLRNHFPRLIGYDLPEMIDKLKNIYHNDSQNDYASLYSSIHDMVSIDNYCALYDSVVLQHLIDRAYVNDLIEKLSVKPSFRTFISLTNQVRPHPHLELLLEKGWSIWHREVETLSFDGAPHLLTIFQRW